MAPNDESLPAKQDDKFKQDTESDRAPCLEPKNGGAGKTLSAFQVKDSRTSASLSSGAARTVSKYALIGAGCKCRSSLETL